MNKIGRNDLCWCGSGKKYKKCHMAEDEKINQIARKEGYYLLPVDNLKGAADIEGIKKSAQINKEIFSLLSKKIQPGITTNQIDQWVYDYTIQAGGIPAPLNYQGFPKSVCTSLNEVICHGIPSERRIEEGDILNIDITSIYEGYYADSNRMFLIGEVTEKARNLVQTAKECLEKGIEQVKPYVSLNEVGRAIEAHANKNKFSVVRDYCGHGVGWEFHEEPQVDHYARQDKGILMRPGMVFTIEPMINEGDFHCRILDDGWTAVTRDGKLSAQWEETIVVTEDGHEVLT